MAASGESTVIIPFLSEFSERYTRHLTYSEIGAFEQKLTRNPRHSIVSLVDLQTEGGRPPATEPLQ